MVKSYSAYSNTFSGNQRGKFGEELTTEQREKKIKAISRGDTESKDVFNSERVCGKHFASGKPAHYWHKLDVDWVPTLQLAKKNYRAKLDHNANAFSTLRLFNKNAGKLKPNRNTTKGLHMMETRITA